MVYIKNKLTSKTLILGFQHCVAMIGSTCLVPLLVGNGMSPSIALLGAGIGTLIFHAFTKGSIPSFLGSSFAFISAIQYIATKYDLSYATGGIFIAGVLYVVYATITHFIGSDKIRKVFPDIFADGIEGVGLHPVRINV